MVNLSKYFIISTGVFKKQNGVLRRCQAVSDVKRKRLTSHLSIDDFQQGNTLS